MTVKVMLPSVPFGTEGSVPIEVTESMAPAVTVASAGVMVQPFISVPVKLYVPSASPMIAGVVPPPMVVIGPPLEGPV